MSCMYRLSDPIPVKTGSLEVNSWVAIWLSTCGPAGQGAECMFDPVVNAALQGTAVGWWLLPRCQESMQGWSLNRHHDSVHGTGGTEPFDPWLPTQCYIERRHDHMDDVHVLHC
jgi:hypothetical protein